MYHKVDLASPTMWWVDVSTFHDQMLALQSRRVVHLEDYDPGDPRHVVVTFDGVYRNVLLYAAPILQRLGYPFELFLSSDAIGRDNEFDPGEPPAAFADATDLSRLVDMGGRLQWHTRSHPRMEVARGAPGWDRMLVELEIPPEVRALDPAGFGWFAYPHGAFSADIRHEVATRFSGAVSCHQGSDSDRYAMNRLTVTNATNLRERSICVIIVSHNYGEFLAEAIESVLQQTYLPDSIVIMDDASSDATRDIGERYAALDPAKIRFLRNDVRMGIVETFNRAVRETASDYICFLGADNRFSANYVERVVAEFARGEADVGVVYTDFLLFGARAEEEYLRHAAERRGRILDQAFYEVTFPEYSREAFLQGNFIHGSAAYLRSAFDAIGGYQANGHRPEDANLFRRMIRAGYTARKARGAWLEYRQHSESQANVISRAQGQLEFQRVYIKRLEMKVKALERAFGVLSPVVRLLGIAEKVLFSAALRVARWWRRRS